MLRHSFFHSSEEVFANLPWQIPIHNLFAHLRAVACTEGQRSPTTWATPCR